MIHTCAKIQANQRGHVSQVCQSYKKWLLNYRFQLGVSLLSRSSLKLGTLSIRRLHPNLFWGKGEGADSGLMIDRSYNAKTVVKCISQFQAWPSLPLPPPPPPGKPLGNFFERANFPPPGTKKVRNSDPWDRKIVPKPHPRGNYSKIQQKISTEMLICLEILKQWNI